MNAATLPREWPVHRWANVVLLIFLVQLGFIFLLGARKPVTPRAPRPVPPVSLLVNGDAAFAELHDPALFFLPNAHGFSAQARALTPRTEFAAADWNEPFRWLPLPAEKLGDTFQQFAAASLAPPVQLAEKIEPRGAALDAAGTPLSPPAQSTLRIEGGLAGRPLLVQPGLPSQPGTDMLRASEVWVMVDVGGRVVSALLGAGSGLADADQKALELSRTLRFEPLREDDPERLAHPLRGLVWGRLIFNWATVPPPAAP
jgi:hypothetical protein